MKQLMTVVLCGIICTGCSDVKLETEEDKTFYTVGTWLGAKLVNLGPTERELNAVIQGIRDTAKKKKPAIDVTKYHRKAQEIFRTRLSKGAERYKKKGTDFMESFLKEGGQKTPSGLVYKVLKEGSGAKPKPSDQVEVHYHGTLVDGSVFDSSVERGKTVSFALNRVIKGWTEGLQMIRPGGKIKLLIPSTLAYGDRGLPPKIPGGATLIFEVELFSVKPAPKLPTKGKRKLRAKKKRK